VPISFKTLRIVSAELRIKAKVLDLAPGNLERSGACLFLKDRRLYPIFQIKIIFPVDNIMVRTWKSLQKIGDKLYEMNKGRTIEGALSKLFHEIMLHVLLPERGSALDKHTSKWERVRRGSSAISRFFGMGINEHLEGTYRGLTKEWPSESDLEPQGPSQGAERFQFQDAYKRLPS
jgi:hypothetical protein